MNEFIGDDLLSLFKKLNIETGNINPNVIRAWFDTDSENLLNWFCSSITEENYLSPQEKLEYINLQHSFTNDELEAELNSIKLEFPGLLNYGENQSQIEFSEDMIQVLEHQLQECDHHLKENEALHQLLSSELSKLSSEEIQAQSAKEISQKTCIKLSSEVHQVNYKSYEQIVRYGNYLSNYDFAQFPAFINNMDITEFENGFIDIVTSINSVMNLNLYHLDNSSKTIDNALLEIQNRLFHSNISHQAFEMEIETLNRMIKFLDNYTTNSIDCKAISKDIEFHKKQQNSMMEIIENLFIKQAENSVNQYSLKYSKKELNFCQSKLDIFNKIRKAVANILSYLVSLYSLYLQERRDIKSSSQFFKKVIHYIKNNLQDSIFRKDGMLDVIDEYEKYSSGPIENKLKLIQYYGLFLRRDTVNNIVEETNSMRSETENLEKNHFSYIVNFKQEQDLRKNVQNLQNFLISGPTCKIVTVPNYLQFLLFDLNSNLNSQSFSVKSIVQMRQKRKEQVHKDKWLSDRRHLWMNFLVDPSKMFNVLDQLKASSAN